MTPTNISTATEVENSSEHIPTLYIGVSVHPCSQDRRWYLTTDAGLSPDDVREGARPRIFRLPSPADAERALGTSLAPFYLQLSADQPGSLSPIALPQLESGPYLSYGLQWLAFGIMAPLGVAYFLYSEIRQRRRRPADAADAPAGTKERLRAAGIRSGSAQRPTIGAAPTAGDADDEVKRKLADRYGSG